jgi:acyl-CoA reductase-like NAD-dependent aldehyde dehydrogenase
MKLPHSGECTVYTMPLKTERKASLHEPLVLEQVRLSQQNWARTALGKRLALLRRFRRSLAVRGAELAQSIPCEQPGALHRGIADTLVCEVLPLADACRFLEREAANILASQRLSTHSRPLWLRGVTAETRREPLGVVLIIGPANYPLFLPGVQTLQALAAGNAVLWKPAPGGSAVAEALREMLVECGLDPALLQVLDESTEAATDAIAAGVDKVFLTGSAATGAEILYQMAPRLTPSVMELSGCDAVFVLPGADVERTVAALAFGLRLNGSATCMAPRRLFLVGSHPSLLTALREKLNLVSPVLLPARTRSHLDDLLSEARRLGGEVLEEGSIVLIRNATAEMQIARTDIFAPVLSVFEVPDVQAALAAHAPCPFALTAAIFGPEAEAHALASRLQVGTVLINDAIVATADPRVSFGGCKSSGFGLTRGREGLLEMTALKTIVTQSSRTLRAYQPTTPAHVTFFATYLEIAHGGWSARWRGLGKFLRAAARLK